MPNTFTHYLVVDSDDHAVLAWFPTTEERAAERAGQMAKDTRHLVAWGIYNDGFEIVGLPRLP